EGAALSPGAAGTRRYLLQVRNRNPAGVEASTGKSCERPVRVIPDGSVAWRCPPSPPIAARLPLRCQPVPRYPTTEWSNALRCGEATVSSSTCGCRRGDTYIGAPDTIRTCDPCLPPAPPPPP